MAIKDYIQERIARGQKMFAVLVDPEKADASRLDALCPLINNGQPDFIFVGGSTGSQIEEAVRALRQRTSVPVVLFPGNVSQFTPSADALLVLSLLSSRNPEFLIGAQVRAARAIQDSGIDTLSVGYILVDGGRASSVQRATGSEPLSAADDIVDTAVAAELLGFQSVYLEAGSGAKTPVAATVIEQVRRRLRIPLFVGGGIRTPEQMLEAYRAGADIVVVGNHFESHPEQIPLFCQSLVSRASDRPKRSAGKNRKSSIRKYD